MSRDGEGTALSSNDLAEISWWLNSKQVLYSLSTIRIQVTKNKNRPVPGGDGAVDGSYEIFPAYLMALMAFTMSGRYQSIP